MQRYQQQLRSLVFANCREEEQLRRHIATRLHDGLGQLLAISRIKLGQLRKNTDGGGISVRSTKYIDSLKDAMAILVR